ncbi:MAG: DUF349 domain-containing protein [Salegentibacter sp.]|uniref:DUF349 domain-containing protein n=1 Tax=Salegentibacter sp. TaxID=1903072 RepID=UPI00287008B6|nr:DUF349 domain-containing protein [Salegentibacter sp.]MDR9457814.1 DUF349 domain-containing protein [Salegentibacter sp.]
MSQEENENRKEELSNKNLQKPENKEQKESQGNVNEENSFSKPEEEEKSEEKESQQSISEKKESELEDAMVEEATSGKSSKDKEAADSLEESLIEEDKASKEKEEPKGDTDKKEAPTDSNVAGSEKDSEENSDQEEEEEEEEKSETKTPKDAQEDVDNAVAEDSEDESAGERHNIAQKDYHSMSKEELADELEHLIKTEKVQAIKEHVAEIRTEFNAKFDEELEEKKEDFLADGGNIIDFHYSTPLKKRFNSLIFDYKEKRNKYYQQLKQDLNKNLNTRLKIIEELKGLIDVEENINTTYKHFKELQDRWKVAGPIPRDQYNNVWNTYHHHVENFYDFLHLNREFRDMDFKHNLEQKLKVIDRAEELLQEADVNRAFRELQMLHKMWKEELGPVGKEYREEIWDRFSTTTKKIHDKRQEYFSKLDEEFEENWKKKQEIIEKIRLIAEENYTTHNKWQQKIKEIEALREEFFKAGKVPRSKNEETWSQFKQEVRKFNRNKNTFYKNLKKQQYDNLEKKKELIKIADDNKDSDDFKTVTPLMKKIQADWKKVGHVPRKDSDKVWKQFKAACNHYFDRLHANRNEENQEEFEAYDRKKEILDKLKALELSGDKKEDLPKIKELIAAWREVGRVPQNKRFIEGKFNKTLDQVFNKIDMDKTKVEMMKYENKLQSINEAEDDRKLQNEHYFLTKKIEETKAEIRQLENNLQFFSNVDEDNPLVQEVHKNIADHKAQLEVWKEKLRKIKSLY